MMPSARRIRMLLFAAILSIFMLFYVTTGPSLTHGSAFYKKTVALMEARAHGFGQHVEPKRRSFGPVAGQAGIEAESDAAAQQTQAGQGAEANSQKTLQEANLSEELKQRLREAEHRAKKSADEKYRALLDIENEVAKERAERVDHKAVLEEARTSIAGSIHDNADVMKQERPEEAELRQLFTEMLAVSPITIFSKSYCPYSRKAKRILLQAYDISPEPHVVELDQHPQGQQLQQLLAQITDRRTVPNILINGKTIGGGDETERLWRSGELASRIKQQGGKRIEKVNRVFAYGEDAPPDSGL